MPSTDRYFEGILCDMDGVLCDSEPLIARAAARMFADRHATSVQPSDFHPFVGTGEERFLGGVAEKYGVNLSMPADKTYTYDLYLQLIRGRLEPLAGVHAFMKACRQRGIKLAVASSADWVKVAGNLEQIGLPPAFFDAVISGDQIRRKKPDPEILLLAADRLGVQPADCLVVEDAPNGVRAGKAAGAWCLGLTTTFDPQTLREAGADRIAKDLDEVPLEWLERPPEGNHEPCPA